MPLRLGSTTPLWLAGWTLALSAAACSGLGSKPTPTPSAMSGTLTGSAWPCRGGPILPAKIGALNVTLTVDIVNDRGQRVARRILRASGQAALNGQPFSLTLPVGRYTVSSPPDAPQSVQITAHKTSRVELIGICD